MRKNDEMIEKGTPDAFPEVSCMDEALQLLQLLRKKMRAQAQQLLVWRRAYKIQEAFIIQLQTENASRLKSLASKLILFESRLIRKQKDISMMLNQRESIIHRQQKIINLLNNRLIDNGLEGENDGIMDVNDGDSAVVMEDVDSDSHIDQITLIRSVSDIKRRQSTLFLKRPEILETVYSVEEDPDSCDTNVEQSEISKKRSTFANSSKMKSANDFSQIEDEVKMASWPHLDNLNEPSDEVISSSGNLRKKFQTSNHSSSFSYSTTSTSERCQGHGQGQNQNQVVTTYNRVMSNHRSVTKPKDVKYKRINKAKSKSLEELRGRLRSWVEQGTKI